MNTHTLSSKHTIAAAYTGYITQAAVNNLPPLLFTAFCSSLGLSLAQLSALISINFVTQLIVDGAAVKLLDKIGIRSSAVAAHIFASAGLILMGILPQIMPPFAGLCISMMICAIGGGLIEVVISPVVEAVPGDEKAAAMSLLHSFYCWGQAGVVLISTLFFAIAGIERWQILTVLWAILPAANAFFFSKVPIYTLLEEGEEPHSIVELMHIKVFPVLLLLMICAGASELGMSQWSSFFAETGLGVSKSMGDILGPCCFALLMGFIRAFYGVKGNKLSLEKMLVFSCILCVFSYLLAALAPIPAINLIGCAICGLSVGMMWPGTFSIAAKSCPKGGNGMYAVLALAGDLGCSAGPALVGIMSGSGGELKNGMLSAVIFPILMLVGIILLSRQKAAEK